MPAVCSTEVKLETGLHEQNCSGRSFVAICKHLGAQVSDGRLSEALAGRKYFDREIGEKLLEILERMRDLQAEVDVPIDWSHTERVSNALTVRLVAQVAKDLDIENIGLQQAAAQATQQVGKG